MWTHLLRLGGAACCLAVVLMVAGPAAQAADYSVWRPAPAREVGRMLPFPRSERAQAVWASAACWAGCQIYCTDALDRCLNESSDQARCLAATDTCDRVCQGDCRLRGGPLIAPIPP